MTFQELMRLLADEYIIGISVASVVCILIYLVSSIVIMRYVRKQGIDVCASAMIPIYNLVLLVRGKLIKRKASKTYAEDEVIEL